jgi:large subunit ribosomal protein L47
VTVCVALRAELSQCVVTVTSDHIHKRWDISPGRLMLSSLRTCTSNALRALGHVRRYSTPVEATPEAVTSSAPGALRPHLNIPVNPNHGLYAFFRKREKDGKVTHDPFEDESGLEDVFGE